MGPECLQSNDNINRKGTSESFEFLKKYSFFFFDLNLHKSRMVEGKKAN